MIEQLNKSADFINEKIDRVPEFAVTLGSGLGEFTNRLENKVKIPYESIPGFQSTSVTGHEGSLIYGFLKDKPVLCLSGRYHAYEGHSLNQVVHPTRVVQTLGIKNLILTNAAGGLNPNFHPGQLVLIKDHLNLTGKNPLVGKNIDELGPRFPDMTETYSGELRSLFKEQAKSMNYDLQEGVYTGVLGPTYETPAEVKMFRLLGGDMVGMSTVAEAIAAHHCGLRVAGVSCITNMATGISEEKLDHDDIKFQALKVMEQFTNLLVNVICT